MTTIRELTDKELDAVAGGGTISFDLRDIAPTHRDLDIDNLKRDMIVGPGS
jgi:bacteriocin-like protein